MVGIDQLIDPSIRMTSSPIHHPTHTYTSTDGAAFRSRNALMAAAGLAGGAGLLWAAQPAPARNDAAEPAAAEKPSQNHRPVYDIDIQSKHFPKEVPAFIEV
jgi:hypothetical protein